jgi:hypothetical protein
MRESQGSAIEGDGPSHGPNPGHGRDLPYGAPVPGGYRRPRQTVEKPWRELRPSHVPPVMDPQSVPRLVDSFTLCCTCSKLLNHTFPRRVLRKGEHDEVRLPFAGLRERIGGEIAPPISSVADDYRDREAVVVLNRRLQFVRAPPSGTRCSSPGDPDRRCNERQRSSLVCFEVRLRRRRLLLAAPIEDHGLMADYHLARLQGAGTLIYLQPGACMTPSIVTKLPTVSLPMSSASFSWGDNGRSGSGPSRASAPATPAYRRP